MSATLPMQTCPMTKIPCSTCGALILPTTAESTGGLCMACKQGIRKDMEASRAYYQALKEYDPFRELWVSLVKRSSEDPTLTNWSDEERTYFSVCLLEGEVYNGGFDQFFSNTSGDYYCLALRGLEDLGASSLLETVKDAAETLFGKSGPPDSQQDRWKIMNSATRRLTEVVTRHRRSSQLDRLDKRFSSDAERLGNLLTAYAEKHGLIQPFLNDPNSASS